MTRFPKYSKFYMPDTPVEKIKIEAPVDKKSEKTVEQIPKTPEEEVVEQRKPQIPAKTLPITEEQKEIATLQKDEETVMVENILSENVNKLYSQLSEAKKIAFRKRGEEVVIKIKTILKGTKIRANEIFELIKGWLIMLPKISTYFLDQEAKIKTDKVLEMKKKGQVIEK